MRITGSEFLLYTNADGFTTKNATRIGPDPATGVVPAQGASFNSGAYPLRQVMMYTVWASWPSTGSPVGTLKLQGSVDREIGDWDQPDAGVTNWFDLSFTDPATGNQVTSVTVSGAGSQAFMETSCGYRWVRAAVTLSSGSISPTMEIQYKGIS
jgi:hypothetical protein